MYNNKKKWRKKVPNYRKEWSIEKKVKILKKKSDQGQYQMNQGFENPIRDWKLKSNLGVGKSNYRSEN